MTADQVHTAASPLRDARDLHPLLERIGEARVVLLGEASHGTHEYYAWRTAITRRLVRELGFSFIAVEGDWPDCYELNRCVKLAEDAPPDPFDVLDAFGRWPTWMWANAEVVELARWLREHNSEQPPQHRVGFYGLDVYSLWESMRAILGYLEEHEPGHVEAARRAMRCFEPYAEDPQEYAWATRLVPTSCEDAVVDLLGQVAAAAHDGARDGDPEAHFNAEQNAAVAAGAERYYRAMVRGGGGSWNIRDHHMTDTLSRLLDHHEPDAKAVVWAHNTHVGDARATDMAAAGMVNLGQLARERWGRDDVVVVGFGGYQGSVIAAAGWGEPPQRLPVPPARADSIESLIRDACRAPSLFVLPARQRSSWMTDVTAHRAIGVVYSPQRERVGNYVPTILAERYDAFCWFDRTNALHPLHGEAAMDQPTAPPWP